MVVRLPAWVPTPSNSDRLLAGAGRIPANWHLIRRIGWLEPDPNLRALDLRAIETREALRHGLAPFLIRLGYTDFDLGDALNRDRRLTQHISRWAYDLGYRAIAYTSRFGAELPCWVLHGSGAEPDQPAFTPLGTAAIERGDPDLVEAARLLGLKL